MDELQIASLFMNGLNKPKSTAFSFVSQRIISQHVSGLLDTKRADFNRDKKFTGIYINKHSLNHMIEESAVNT